MAEPGQFHAECNYHHNHLYLVRYETHSDIFNVCFYSSAQRLMVKTTQK